MIQKELLIKGFNITCFCSKSSFLSRLGTLLETWGWILALPFIICVVLLKYWINGGIVINSVPVSGVHISFILLSFHYFSCSSNYQILLKTTSLDVCYFQYVYQMQTANFINYNGWLLSLSWIFLYKMRFNVQTFYNHPYVNHIWFLDGVHRNLL